MSEFKGCKLFHASLSAAVYHIPQALYNFSTKTVTNNMNMTVNKTTILTVTISITWLMTMKMNLFVIMSKVRI